MTQKGWFVKEKRVRRPWPSRRAQGWRPWPLRADSGRRWRDCRNRRPSSAVELRTSLRLARLTPCRPLAFVSAGALASFAEALSDRLLKQPTRAPPSLRPFAGTSASPSSLRSGNETGRQPRPSRRARGWRPRPLRSESGRTARTRRPSSAWDYNPRSDRLLSGFGLSGSGRCASRYRRDRSLPGASLRCGER